MDDLFGKLVTSTETRRVITDIKVVSDGNEKKAKSKCPGGYTLIDADLNRKSGGDYVYICVKYEDIAVMKDN